LWEITPTGHELSAVDPTGRPAISVHIVTEFGGRIWYFNPEHLQGFRTFTWREVRCRSSMPHRC
jgi:hypothetical protein